MLLSRIMMLGMALLLAMTLISSDAEAKKRNRSSKKSQTSSSTTGVNDPRYAALIMNPQTGEIYHAANANARRYPASLTKMMTLYLLFEALEQKKISLDDRMEVSALAARQPQTNLSLDEGDSIEVETAIKALVVRSANDVSVVVAEALAGDVDRFAQRMTSRARSLGMKNTTFKNPNGLPNTGQVTTAADMAKLGIALKRDFPRYYRYFSTLQFSHNGVSYYTHNRVMLRYAGVDGIKTGYIGASGFNLVTSVTRGGRPLVGVVMGGRSGSWRDSRMIELLDDVYANIASRGAARGKSAPANLPLSKAGGAKGIGATGAVTTPTDVNALDPNLVSQALLEPEAADEGGANDVLPPVSIPEQRAEIRQAAPVASGRPVAAPVPSAVGSDTISRSPIMITPAPAATVPSAAMPAPPTPFDVAKTQTAVPLVADEASWGIQVGAFSSQPLAEQAAQTALRLAPQPLARATMVVGAPTAGVAVHRARLEHLTQLEARKACEVLIFNNTPCFIYQAIEAR